MAASIICTEQQQQQQQQEQQLNTRRPRQPRGRSRRGQRGRSCEAARKTSQAAAICAPTAFIRSHHIFKSKDLPQIIGCESAPDASTVEAATRGVQAAMTLRGFLATANAQNVAGQDHSVCESKDIGRCTADTASSHMCGRAGLHQPGAGTVDGGDRKHGESHVRFNLQDVVVHAVVPYSEIYGLHPREFVFDRMYAMIPAVGPFGFVGLDQGEDSDEEGTDDDDFLF